MDASGARPARAAAAGAVESGPRSSRRSGFAQLRSVQLFGSMPWQGWPEGGLPRLGPAPLTCRPTARSARCCCLA